MPTSKRPRIALIWVFPFSWPYSLYMQHCHPNANPTQAYRQTHKLYTYIRTVIHAALPFTNLKSVVRRFKICSFVGFYFLSLSQRLHGRHHESTEIHCVTRIYRRRHARVALRYDKPVIRFHSCIGPAYQGRKSNTIVKWDSRALDIYNAGQLRRQASCTKTCSSNKKYFLLSDTCERQHETAMKTLFRLCKICSTCVHI